jgi:DNA adenine methylase
VAVDGDHRSAIARDQSRTADTARAPAATKPGRGRVAIPGSIRLSAAGNGGAYRSGSPSERFGLLRPQNERDVRRKFHPDPAARDDAVMAVRSLPRARRDLRPAPRDSIAAPVVKWVGGKTKLLPELLARIPERFARYHEPFCGGAALFFRIAPERAVIADSNPDLMGLYACLARDVAGVIRRLEHHRAAHCEAHYYATRTRWNDRDHSWSSADRAATFIYLNKTCFNGLWRVNRAGAFNVPIGRYTDPPICVPEALRAAGALLARATLRCTDYATAVADARRGDFVYFDPPYDPVAPTANFTSYTTDTFGADDQRALADTARALVARGCQVMLSNSDTPFVRSLYRGFQIDRVKCGRAINSNGARRGEVDEVIVTAGY